MFMENNAEFDAKRKKKKTIVCQSLSHEMIR